MFLMSRSPKSRQKRSPRVDPSRSDLADPDASLKTCAQCMAKVTRSECHKNRYGQYICLACRAKLQRAVQLPAGDMGVPIRRSLDTTSDAGLSGGNKKPKASRFSLRRLPRNRLPVGRVDVRERIFHASINLLVSVVVMLVVWFIWVQF